MLYERWRQIAREQRSEIALRDFASGQSWTFATLAAEADKPGSSKSRGNETQISFPQGANAGFVLTVLRAWRSGQIVCPLEPGQAVPPPGQLPPGIVHL